MRAGKYALLFLLAFASGIYLAPKVSSEPSPSPSASAPSPLQRSEAPGSEKELTQRKVTDEFFRGPILHLAIEMEKEEFDRLKRDNRSYSEAILKERDGKTYKGVAVKLKGAAGSFQGVDGKPGMTLSFDKFKGSERFHGMKRFHLNNCVQDGTYLMELIGGEIARQAGVPASRCTHAFVSLNGRELGLYVVKEAFTKDFLSYFYADPTGNLYDGGFLHEVSMEIEKDQGDPNDKSDIKTLIAACAEADHTKRWERLGEILNIDAFISYMALEAILGHWDGYNFNRNNFRIYHDPETDRLSFFLHGMDQVLGDVNFPLMRDFGAMVGRAVMRCPEGKRLYVARLESVHANVLQPVDWAARVVEVGNKVKEALATKNPQWAREYERQINAVRDRVSGRIAAVGKQLAEMPKPVEFDSRGILRLETGWRSEGRGAQIDEVQLEGKPCLHIKTHGESNASWRRTLALESGRYRFEGKVRTANVKGSAGASGEGAGLRISGSNRRGKNGLTGDAGWQTVAFEFDTPGAHVVLVAELRASQGEAWFESGSLQLVRVR